MSGDAVDVPGGAQAIVTALVALWQAPPTDGPAGFARLYADPLTINGTPTTPAELARRAGALHTAYADVDIEVLDVVAARDRVVVAFVMRARHVGPLATPLGVVAATGRQVTSRTVDVLRVHEGRITDITVVADDLGVLTQLDAVRLQGTPAGA